jgi:hypothetical protein
MSNNIEEKNLKDSLLCPLCSNLSTGGFMPVVYTFKPINSDAEAICIHCIESIIISYFSYKNIDYQFYEDGFSSKNDNKKQFKILMNTSNIIEKLTKCCNRSSNLLDETIYYECFDFAEMLIEKCYANVDKLINICYDDKIQEVSLLISNSHKDYNSKILRIKFLLKHGADREFKDINDKTYCNYLNFDEKIEIQEYIDTELTVSLKPAKR